MPPQPIKREFAFTIMDVARLLKTYADQRARQFGISRAQWAVLVRIDRNEGLKQTELADLLDLQPITLTRLLDRLADNGLIDGVPIRTIGAPIACTSSRRRNPCSTDWRTSARR